MKVLNHLRTLEELCRATGKWGAYFNIYIPDHDKAYSEIPKAALWFNWKQHGQLAADESGYILCDSETEIDKIYEQTVGDDGATSLNQYDGDVRIYMITCNPSGQLEKENT